jgi:hypothetical protein
MFFPQDILSDIALGWVASQFTVLPIGFGDGQLKGIAMIAFYFFNGRSI